MADQNLSFPWYSALSTGILEIDNQHGNIDILLQLFEAATQIHLEQIAGIEQALQTHFAFEEELFGSHFPPGHQHEHINILAYVAEQREKFEKQDFDRISFIRHIEQKLFEHISIFDKYLKSYLPPDSSEK